MIYVLAVGIDVYAAPEVSNLTGAVNDVHRLLAFMRSTYPNRELSMRALFNHQAKRSKLIRAFHHLKQAGPEDTVLFYFSGHGSQGVPASIFRKMGSPNDLEETILCFDSRLPGVPDLADKELGALMFELWQNRPNIVAIMDCCHAASTFRDPVESGKYLARFSQPDLRERPFQSYYGYPYYQNASGFTLPVLQHQMVNLSACAEGEQAHESMETRGGVFTNHLLSTLEKLREEKSLQTRSYPELFQVVEQSVKQEIPHQRPQLESYGNYNLYRSFLSGIISPPLPRF